MELFKLLFTIFYFLKKCELGVSQPFNNVELLHSYSTNTYYFPNTKLKDSQKLIEKLLYIFSQLQINKSYHINRLKS